MKHIKKRFLIEVPVDSIDLTNSSITKFKVSTGVPQKELKNNKGSLAYLHPFEEENLIGGFIQNINGKHYVIPVPDPTLIYFNNAQYEIGQIKRYKKRLLNKLNLDETNEINSINEGSINEIYQYFGATSGFVIFLFTAMESFMNQIIPDDYIYRKESNNKTEIWNKKQIQEGISFNVKMKKILKDITGVDFFKNQTPINQRINNLKEFRDAVVHTKQNDSPLQYDELLKKALNFKYEDTLEAVRKFMNFYHEGYIIECNCGKDF